MGEVCDNCGAPLSVGQGSAEVEIDSLKMEIERLRDRERSTDTQFSRMHACIGRDATSAKDGTFAGAVIEEIEKYRRLLRQAVELMLLNEVDHSRSNAIFIEQCAAAGGQYVDDAEGGES